MPAGGACSAAHRSGAATIATLWHANGHITIKANPANNRVDFTLTAPNSTTVTAGVQAVAGEQFHFGRGSQVLVGIAYTSSGYRLAVSVGGTEVRTSTHTSLQVTPSRVRFGDKDFAHVDAMYWYGGRVDESTALSVSQLESSLQNLDMLYQRLEVLIPPIGGGPE